MKILLSLIILFVPFSILAKQICLAPSGCRIEMDTGFCPKCIEVKEEPPIIKEEKVVVEKKPIVKIPPKVSHSKDRKPRERNWVGILFKCIVGCKENVKYWDEGGNEFDENLDKLFEDLC